MAELASGHLAIRALAQAGIEHLFTLSGGHIFPLYDGCRHEGVRMVDVRHEQTAMFAAEGLAKLTTRPQVAALTAGPGVTNGVSAVANARFGGSPVLLLGGRAPQATWGQGSLQEIDHVAFMSAITKQAATSLAPPAVARDTLDALRVAAEPHRGPTFLDIPMDVIFSPADEGTVPVWTPPVPAEIDVEGVRGAAALLRDARSVVVVSGTDVWYGGAHGAVQSLVETLQTPVITNGLGRGTVPADHDLAISRARGTAFKGADVVVVIGTPLDFRLGFGTFGSAKVIHIVDAPDQAASHATVAVRLDGDIRATVEALTESAGGPTGDLAEARAAWAQDLRDVEAAKRAGERDLLEADSDPIHPVRIYGELRKVLDRDAVVIGDGGDFVSYAGRFVDSHRPGCWLDPGPYGCLGTGMGYSIAGRLARPDAQVVTMLGDGAAGFSLMDVDTLVRHDLPVVMVVGNNGIWALEKYPMQAIYDGWDAVADLQPGVRYDEIVATLGGAGETVERAADLGPALRRAFDARVPYLVNVLTDPGVAYPRSTVLA
jgi:acetolactate synthase I/II/III large subunit